MHWLNRILLAALLGCAVAFLPHQFDPDSGPGALTRSEDLGRVLAEQAQLERDNRQLRDEIALLQAEISALKSDPRELERIAREDLNLIHQGEVVFEVQPDRTVVTQARDSQ